MELDKTKPKLRVLMLGVFDLFHYGHAQAMLNAKNAFPNTFLIVGVHSDKTTEKFKGKVVMTEVERYEVVKHIKYVDEVLKDAPWIVTKEYIDQNKIDFVVGSDDVVTETGEDTYRHAKALGKFKEIPRVEGVSSTLILTRIVRNYDVYLNKTLEKGYTMKELNVGWMKGMQISTKKRVKDVLQGRWPSWGSGMRIGGFVKSFGEKVLHDWNILGATKELGLQRGNANYPSKNVLQSSAEPDELKEVMPIALKECKIHVKGWENISQPDIKLSVVSGGLTNKLYKVMISQQLFDKLNEDKGQENTIVIPHQVLLRIYGAGTETFFNRENEHKIFKTFSDRGIGPKLHGIFEGGRVEEFLELHSLQQGDLPQLALSIAQQIAATHSSTINLPKTPSLFDSLRHWLKNAQQVTFPDDPEKQKLLDNLKIDTWTKELDELQSVLESANSPVVFCHNDLIGGNIMYNDDTKRLCFIDYEYGSYNFRGFDIGNHFCEWIIKYNLPEYPHFKLNPRKYPRPEQQRKFLKTYLKEMHALKDEPPAVSEEELQKLISEVNKFAMASHFLWSCWAVIQASTSDIDFGYLEFATKRMEDYFRRKDWHFYGKGKPLDDAGAQSDEEESGFEEFEKHQFEETRFTRPTWCQECKYFVMSPFGKQGYSCKVCGMKVHRHCVDKVTSQCIIHEFTSH